jgi:acyl carrier protein
MRSVLVFMADESPVMSARVNGVKPVTFEDITPFLGLVPCLRNKARRIALAATILVVSQMASHPALLSLRIEVHRLLSFVLRRPIREDENPSRATEPGWDSLKHVELVFLIEDHFGMRFREPEIAKLDDARQIERLVEEMLAEKRGEACATA